MIAYHYIFNCLLNSCFQQSSLIPHCELLYIHLCKEGYFSIQNRRKNVNYYSIKFQKTVSIKGSLWLAEIDRRTVIYSILILQVETLEGEERYSRTIRQLLDDHQSVVTHLAEGFHECQKNVPVSWHCIAHLQWYKLLG